MRTEITGSDPEQGIGVEVYDQNDNYHWVVVMWDGDIDGHETDDYPHSKSDRTLEEQKIMTQVEERAKLAAQQEFPDADILEAEWVPEEVERAIVAIQRMPVDRFAEEFETCYRMVTDPTSVLDIPEGSAQLLFQPFLIDQDNTVEYVPTPMMQYRPDGADSARVTEQEQRFEELARNPDLTKFTITLPPLTFTDGDYEFPDGFQVFVIEHLGAQVRDLYRHVGEQPPGDYADIDDGMPGVPLTAADEEFYPQF